MLTQLDGKFLASRDYNVTKRRTKTNSTDILLFIIINNI